MTHIAKPQDMTGLRNRAKFELTRYVEVSDGSVRGVNSQAENLVNMLFKQLKVIFPASYTTIFKDPDAEPAAKRQWIVAFAENGIATVDQVSAGMRVARQQNNDFWPSCGKFIAWCHDGAGQAYGLPCLDSVMSEFRRYSIERGLYGCAEEFPWSSPVLYWIVTDMRQAMHQYKYTPAELRRCAERQLQRWQKKILSGERIPLPQRKIAAITRPMTVGEERSLLSAEIVKKGEAFLNAIRQRNARGETNTR